MEERGDVSKAGGGGRDEGNRGEEAEKPATGGEVTRLWGQTEDMNNLSTLLMDRLGEKMKRDGAREREILGGGVQGREEERLKAEEGEE